MKKLDFDLDDLKVESFEVLPELAPDETATAVGARAAITSEPECYSMCQTRCLECCYPTNGNGSDAIGAG